MFIDHDVSPWGVRGLLCTRCNTTLGATEDTWPSGQEYLANSWWRQQCAALGVPAERSPEPGIGAAIRNQWGTVFIHHGTWWQTPYQNGHSWPATSWDRLYASYGPHNLIPVDLAALMASEECPRGLEWEVRNSDYWVPVLAAIGLAGPQATA